MIVLDETSTAKTDVRMDDEVTKHSANSEIENYAKPSMRDDAKPEVRNDAKPVVDEEMNILIHVIDGFVIEEANTPFPGIYAKQQESISKPLKICRADSFSERITCTGSAANLPSLIL